MNKSIDPVLRKAWLHGFRTKSDFARLHADEVAIAASLGLITTKIGSQRFDRNWHITRKGMGYLGEVD
jgi:hypothetical protein